MKQHDKVRMGYVHALQTLILKRVLRGAQYPDNTDCYRRIAELALVLEAIAKDQFTCVMPYCDTDGKETAPQKREKYPVLYLNLSQITLSAHPSLKINMQ